MRTFFYRTQTYQSLCKSYVLFILNSLAYQDLPFVIISSCLVIEPIYENFVVIGFGYYFLSANEYLNNKEELFCNKLNDAAILK